MGLVNSILSRIRIGKSQGNSKQDLMLSLCGYKFGTLIRKGILLNLKEGSSWVRSNLCDTPPISLAGGLSLLSRLYPASKRGQEVEYTGNRALISKFFVH